MLSHSVQPESGELIRSNRRATSHTCLHFFVRETLASVRVGECWRPVLFRYSFEKNTKRRHEDANEALTDTNAHERNTPTRNIPGRYFIYAEPSPSSEWTLMEFHECQPNSRFFVWPQMTPCRLLGRLARVPCALTGLCPWTCALEGPLVPLEYTSQGVLCSSCVGSDVPCPLACLRRATRFCPS